MRIPLLVVLLFVAGITTGQKHDYQWLFGFGNFFATPTDSIYGGRTLDFNYEPAKVFKHIRQAGFDEANVSFCDSDGRLLFYSNAVSIYDNRDSIMHNGDSINYGKDWEQHATIDGLRMVQGLLALPSSGNSKDAFLLHYSKKEYIFSSLRFAFCDTSLFSVVDFDNNIYGSVEKKNVKIDIDTLSYANFSAVQHGNGQDWWIIHPRYNGNCYKEFLSNRTEVKLQATQCIGPDRLHIGSIGTSCFSPNGNKYFWVTSQDGIRMFDFDRCSGLLSNPQIIPFPTDTFGSIISPISGIAVSSSSRYLYVMGSVIALQYDLLANDIGASVDTVAFYDGAYDPYPFPATFFIAQLAPDGKIYINSTNSTRSLHVINRPDERGDSCLFVQRQVDLGSINLSSMPNFPNYRLGRLPGSACDTLWTNIDEATIQGREKILKVFPNPSADVVTIDYGFTDWSKTGEVSLDIVNELGQIVHCQMVPRYSGFQKIDISRYSPGLYTAYIKRGGGLVATEKFAKE